MKHSQQENPQFKKDRINRIRLFLKKYSVDLVLTAIFLLVTVLYAFLMVKDSVPLIGMASLGLLILFHFIVSGRLSFATPMDFLLLGLVFLLPLSLNISIDWRYSLPKVYGLLLGIVIFYGIVNTVRSLKTIYLAVIGLLILAVLVSLLGLVGTDWPENKLFDVHQIYDLLPRLLTEVPRSTSGGGIQTNIVGGALAFFIPLIGSLFWDGGSFDPSHLFKNKRLISLVKVTYKLLLVLVLLLVSVTLVLTQSRGAFLATAVGLFGLALWKDRRFLWVILPLAASLAILLWGFPESKIAGIFMTLDIYDVLNTSNRPDIWKRAFYLIQDFPLTGSGIGTFSRVVDLFYPPFPGIFKEGIHAHNMFLSVAVDLGIPALVLYIARLSSVVSMVWTAYKRSHPILRTLLIGLTCGLLAHQVFGITDAFSLGTKLGVIMWIYFGLITAIYIHNDRFRPNQEQSFDQSQQRLLIKLNRHRMLGYLSNILLSLGIWIVFTLIATGLISSLPIVSLAAASTGGILLGIILTQSFEANAFKTKNPRS